MNCRVEGAQSQVRLHRSRPRTFIHQVRNPHLPDTLDSVSVISKARGVSCSASEDEAKTWCNQGSFTLSNRFGEFGGEDLETRVIGYASGLCRTARRSFLVLWVSGGYVALMLHGTSMKGQMLNASLGTNKCVASAIGVSDGKKRFIDAARTTPSVRPRKEDAISRNNSCLIAAAARSLASRIWILYYASRPECDSAVERSISMNLFIMHLNCVFASAFVTLVHGEGMYVCITAYVRRKCTPRHGICVSIASQSPCSCFSYYYLQNDHIKSQR